MNMNSRTAESFPKLFTHLADVENDPERTRLNIDLLKDSQLALGASTPREILWRLLSTGERLLTVLQEEPRPLTRLLEVVVSRIPFDELSQVISTAKLEAGLNSPSVSINLLCLAYLRKAADSPSGAAWVGSNASLVRCLITKWLSTESTESSDQSLDTILVLLQVDHLQQSTFIRGSDRTGEVQGQGLLWRRLFHDEEVYQLLYYFTSLRSPEYCDRSRNAIDRATVAQARLFDFITRVVHIDWSDVLQSHFPEVEARYCEPAVSTGQGRVSLLSYAALGMVDLSDPLMNLLRRDFFTKLLAAIEEQSRKPEIPQKLLETIVEGVGPLRPDVNQANGGMFL